MSKAHKKAGRDIPSGLELFTEAITAAYSSLSFPSDLLLMLPLLRPRGGAAVYSLKLSFRATARLNTGCSGAESLLSRQK